MDWLLEIDLLAFISANLPCISRNEKRRTWWGSIVTWRKEKSHLGHSAWQQFWEGAVSLPRKDSLLWLIATVLKGQCLGVLEAQARHTCSNAKDHLNYRRMSLKNVVVLIIPLVHVCHEIKESAISCYTLSGYRAYKKNHCVLSVVLYINL